MANYFNLTLDTLGPQSPSISLEGGATYATQQLITATIGTSDTPTTNYQMKLWGDVDNSNDANVQTTEGASSWVTYATSKQVKLSATDGSKTVYCKIRDDVYNESSQASDAITLNTTVPVVTITGPDVSKISKITGKTTSSFTFVSDVAFEEYKVKVVPSSSSIQSAGTTIGTAAGSTNMAGSAGGYPSGTPISCAIKGTDLETASAGDGDKVIKVFVRNAASLWSV